MRLKESEAQDWLENDGVGLKLAKNGKSETAVLMFILLKGWSWVSGPQDDGRQTVFISSVLAV